jgi:dipeptidyl aminopeptidase/acylaminoacyl peptidase
VTNDELQDLLRTGIQAAQSGNKAVARQILEQVIERDPDSELAWIWLATLADNLDERRAHLERVIAINPDNTRARQALEQIIAAPPAPATPAPPRMPRQARRAERPAGPVPTLDREALFEPKPESQPRRRSRHRWPPLLIALVALLAIALIALGLILLNDELRQGQDATPLAPSPISATATDRPSATPEQAAGPSDFPTATPLGGVLRTLPPQETFPPTWTPSPTQTPTATLTLTPTLPPLSSNAVLVSARRAGETGWSLHTLRGDGTGERRLPLRLGAADEAAGLALVEVYDAAYSPDGETIALTARLRAERLEDGSTVTVEFEEIFVAPARGGDMRRLTQLEAAQTGDAVWSPDGEQIAFASDADGDFDLYTIDADGGPPRLLTRNTAHDRYPAWSPDGEWIAFASDENTPGEMEIWRMRINGADKKQLTNHANSSFAPAWSPDGSTIVFLSTRWTHTDIFLMNADGTNQRALIVRDLPSEERDPAWSPDGEWIAFSSNRETAWYELYVARTDGSDLQRLTMQDNDTRYPAWTP